MSLVGPRPLVLAEHAALSEAWQSRRADLRPGLTGPWQVSGRSHIPFQDMIKFDYQYVAGWSLARDIEILLATLPAVISGRGAYSSTLVVDAAVLATIRSSVKCSACRSREAAAIRARRPASCSSSITASASALGSLGGTRSPSRA